MIIDVRFVIDNNRKLFLHLLSFMNKFSFSLLSFSILVANASFLNAWVDSKRHNDLSYFLHSSTPRIEIYDLANELWAPSVSLTSIPTAFEIDDDYFYVAFGQSVYRYDHNGMNGVAIGNFNHIVHGLFVDGDLLFAVYSAGLYTHINSFNRNTLVNIDTLTEYVDSTYGASISRDLNSIYGRTQGISPADIVVTT